MTARNMLVALAVIVTLALLALLAAGVFFLAREPGLPLEVVGITDYAVLHSDESGGSLRSADLTVAARASTEDE